MVALHSGQCTLISGTGMSRRGKGQVRSVYKVPIFFLYPLYMLFFMWIGVVSCAARRSYSSPDRTNCRPRELEGNIACNPAKRLYILLTLRQPCRVAASDFYAGRNLLEK